MRRLVALFAFALVASVPAVGAAQVIDEEEEEAEQEAEETEEDLEESGEEVGEEAEETEEDLEETGEEAGEEAEETEEDLEETGEDAGDEAEREAEETEEEAERIEQETEETNVDVEQEADGDDDEQMEVRFENADDDGNDGVSGTFGVIGGPGLTNIAADDDDLGTVSGDQVGFSVGIQAGVDFNDIVGLAPQLLFSRRGWESEGEALDLELDNEYMLSYIDLPVMLRIGVPIADVVAPKVMVGPHGSLFVDGERSGETGGPFVDGQGTVDIENDDVNTFQFGLTAAAGVDFNLDGGVLTTDVRFVRNFTGVFDTDDLEGDDNVYHQSWYVMVGFMF